MLHPYNSWDSFFYLYSANTVQKLLKKCYQKQNIELAEKKSFENAYPFIYYLEHGQVYYDQAAQSPLMVKPVLLFYGLVHLAKACILTVDPNYPETTSVLAHGVSTRKRKKQQYSFFQDEVKFQRSGLFPYMAEKMFHMKHLEGEKTTMEQLLKQIPELNDLFVLTDGTNPFVHIKHDLNLFSIPCTLLDNYHMTEDRFIQYLQTKTNSTLLHQTTNHGNMSFTINNIRNFSQIPMKYHFQEQHFYFPTSINALNDYPELLIHYLLLYNLSMIARYETEWWSELIKMMPNQDYPFIQTFLQHTSKKGPFLIYQYLMNRLHGD